MQIVHLEVRTVECSDVHNMSSVVKFALIVIIILCLFIFACYQLLLDMLHVVDNSLI